MEQSQCPQGHFYTPAYPGDASCPHCAKVNMDILKTVPAYSPTVPIESSPAQHTTSSTVAGATKPLYHFEDSKMAPVVGWLVCESGAERGKDYRIVPGRNFIGRAAGMAIRIGGDEAISRENHAVISYNPRKRSMTLGNGDSAGLVYLNGDEILSPVELKAFDRIELGKTTLIFMPFCSPEFGWPDGQ